MKNAVLTLFFGDPRPHGYGSQGEMPPTQTPYGTGIQMHLDRDAKTKARYDAAPSRKQKDSK